MILLHFLFYLFYAVISVKAECHVAINEVMTNVYRFETQHTLDFLELQALDCYSPPNIRNYLLLYIQLDFKPNPLVVQHVSLFHQSFRPTRHAQDFYRYITYGNNNSPTNIKQDLQDGVINWILQADFKQRNPFENVIPLGKNFAFVLLATEKGVKGKTAPAALSKLSHLVHNVNKRTSKVKLSDGDTINYILDNAIDAVIVVGNRDVLSTQPFAQQLSEKLTRPILLIDIRAEKVNSVNVCGVDRNEYKLSPATPGEANNCEGNLIPTLVVQVNNEDDSGDANQPEGEASDMEIEVIEQQPCAPKRPASDDACTVPNKMSCPWYDRSMPWPDFVRILKRVNFVSDNVLESMKEQKAWMELVDSETGALITVEDVTTKVGIRCKYCHEYRIEHNLCVDIDANHKVHPGDMKCTQINRFANRKGYSNPKDMGSLTRGHPKSEQHKKSENYFKNLVCEANEGRRRETEDKKDPTCCNLRLVYEETQSNVPFARHPQFVQMLKSNGVNCGLLHFSKAGAKDMMMSMAKTLKNDFIKYLKRDKPPLALIMDTSTDTHGRNILIIYIRVFHNNGPHVYFYDAVQLPRETGEVMMTTIEKLFTEDGILELFKSNLIGLATDGAAVMSGNDKGLKGRFTRFTKNPNFVHIHCAAHRLELVCKDAFNAVIKEIDVNLKGNLTAAVNGIADFFGTRAVKRKSFLVEICDDMGIVVYALTRIFDVRWAASQESALKADIQMYGCIWKTLSTLRDSKDDEQIEQKSGADEKLTLITNANFFAAIAYFHDIFDILKQYSTKYQRETGVLPGQKSSYLNLQQRLEQLKVTPGPHLAAAVSRISCNIPNLNGLKRGQECQPYFFDSSARISDSVVLYLDYNNPVDDPNFEFANHNPLLHWPALKLYRDKFIDAMIVSLKKYYNDANLEDFEALNPKIVQVDVEQNTLNFPENANEMHRKLAERLKVNSPNLGVQLKQLYESVAIEISFENFKKWTNDPAEIFFYKVLERQSTSPVIELSSELHQYISRTLTVPVGSSDAERGFSILFHALDKRRTSLKVDTIAGILTIRINGPSLQKFDCQKYLTDWKMNHMESDAQPPRGPDKDDDPEESDDPVYKKFVRNEYLKTMWEKRDSIFTKKRIEL